MNSYVVCIKTKIMVEVNIEVNSSDILNWIRYYLIKLGKSILKRAYNALEIIVNEVDFLIHFEYTRTNIIRHLTQKAMVFFGYDPEEKGLYKTRKGRLKKVNRRKYMNLNQSNMIENKPHFWQKYFKLNVLRRKNLKKNQNFFIPKQE